MKTIVYLFTAFLLSGISGQNALNENKIKPDSANADEFFGYAVDMDGGRAIVGAPVVDPFEVEGGSVYIYERQGGWVQKAHVRKWDQDQYKSFGTDVGISGDYAIVGAPTSKLKYGISSGAAYIFHRSEGIWTQQARFDGETMMQGLDFGQAVDIDGQYAIVGAHDYDKNLGAAFIYFRRDTVWELQARINGGGVGKRDRFGWTVAIEGNYAAVGAPEGDEGRGNVYLFSRSGETWNQYARLTAEANAELPADPDIQEAVESAMEAVASQDISSELGKEVVRSEGDNFGISIDMEDGKLIVGAPGHDYSFYGDFDEGTAYIFDVASARPLAKLRNDDARKGTYEMPQLAFGTSVSISGNQSLIGAAGAGGDNGMTGGAYVFMGASQSKFYIPSDANGDIQFGQAVALSSGCSWVGAPGEGWDSQKLGAIYSYCGTATEVPQEVELDLVLHKPKVIDEEQSVIDDEDEEDTGTQTFVNIDNDDEDYYYDDAEMDGVNGGDDELVPVAITLKPNTITDGKVTLKAKKGEENIRLWKSKERVYGMLFDMELSIADEFEMKGEVLVDTIWVEGIKAHDKQQGTVLEMTYEGDSTPCPSNCSDAVALTIIGVKTQTWKGRGNGYTADGKHDSDDLDECPVHKEYTVHYKSNRVFPGARYPHVNVDNQIVDLEVELTVEPIEDVDLYVRSFDADDPSFDTDFVDPNDQLDSQGGTYPGTSIAYTAQGDNRGHPKAGFLENEDDNKIAKLTFPEGSKKESLIFYPSFYAGDNYRAFVYGDKDFLKLLRNKDGEDDDDIVDGNVPVQEKVRWDKLYPTDENSNAQYASNVLAVWRILHVEIDAMLDGEYELVEGLVTGLSADLKKLHVNQNLDDGSANQDSPSPGFPDCGSPDPAEGRYHLGSIMLAESVTILIESNGVNYVNIDAWPNLAEFSLPFSATTSSGIALSGDIVWMTADNGYMLTLEVPGTPQDQIPWSDLDQGTISIGGGPAMNISSVDASIYSVYVGNIAIPFMLADDDQTTEIPFPTIDIMTETFKSVYILPVNDGGGDISNNKKNVPFARNTPLSTDPALVSNVEPYRESKTNETDIFWVVYLVGAHEYAPCHYDGRTVGDGDPNRESIVYGISPPSGTTSMHSIGVGGDITYMFYEGIRESFASPGWPDIDPGITVAHEVGHQFGLGHDQGGLMGPGKGSSKLAKESENLMRSRVKSPGE